MAIEGDGPPWTFTPEDAPRWAHEMGSMLAEVFNEYLAKERDDYDEVDQEATRLMILAVIESLFGDDVLAVVVPNDERAFVVFDELVKEIKKNERIALGWRPRWREEQDG